MKVLVITYDFFPDNSPNTYRWFNVLKEWIEKDVEVYVVAGQKDNFKDYEEKDGIKIYRTGNSWLDLFRKKISNVNQNVSLQNQNNISKKAKLVKYIYDLTWKKLYFPDFAFLWQPSAYRKAETLIKENGIENVITISWPFSAHVVGAKLKSKHNIFWIADTIDPFYLSKAVNNNFLYHSLNYRFEKKILYSADIVTVLTEKLKRKYAFLYPSIAEKIVVNHNIFIPYKIDLIRTTKSAQKIKLVFVGTLSPVTRSPERLLDFFVSLLEFEDLKDKLDLSFYGNTEQCSDIINKYDYLLNKSLFVKGFVSRESIPAILNEADILVNIGNNNEYQEPSKILEYVYLQKPILNVCSIENDTAKEMLEEYSLFFNVDPDEVSCSIRIEEFRSLLLSSEVVVNENRDKILEKYLFPEVEKKYFKLLKTI